MRSALSTSKFDSVPTSFVKSFSSRITSLYFCAFVSCCFIYNMQLVPKMLLIEAGAQTNTVQEMKNAMEPLAESLNRVLNG